tara:strand:- start:369 stop:530 length:162 start_codon:yes stop_codon:yes gene_type:complete
MEGNQGSRNIINYDLLANKVAQANLILLAKRVLVDVMAKTSVRVPEMQERARF